MVQNKLFRDCLAAIPAEQKAEFDLSFGIAERLSEILKEKGLSQKTLPECSISETLRFPNGSLVAITSQHKPLLAFKSHWDVT